MRHFFAMGMLVALLSPSARADTFDYYFNNTLALVPTSKNAEKVTELTPDLMVRHSRALPNIQGTFLVVKTNEGRFSKLLVQPARQKTSAEDSVPILLIDRFVTYRDGEERAIQAQGKNIRLFADFRFNLDMGQVVPKGLGADLRFVVDGDNVSVQPVGKAEIYLVAKHLPEANPAKGMTVVVGEKFEPRYFNGSYKLYDDGRRSGLLKLTVADNGDIDGSYYSDKDGQKYDVSGKVGTPNHQIQFTITFQRTLQSYSGHMFTGDGQAIAGTAKMQDRETGFYAVRVHK